MDRSNDVGSDGFLIQMRSDWEIAINQSHGFQNGLCGDLRKSQIRRGKINIFFFDFRLVFVH